MPIRTARILRLGHRSGPPGFAHGASRQAGTYPSVLRSIDRFAAMCSAFKRIVLMIGVLNYPMRSSLGSVTEGSRLRK
eukprot:6172272-Pleurochrysis_carterae.AAC.1